MNRTKDEKYVQISHQIKIKIKSNSEQTKCKTNYNNIKLILVASRAPYELSLERFNSFLCFIIWLVFHICGQEESSMLALSSQPNEEQLFGASGCETSTDTVNYYFLMFFFFFLSFMKAKNGFYLGFELKSDSPKYIIRCE